MRWSYLLLLHSNTKGFLDELYKFNDPQRVNDAFLKERGIVGKDEAVVAIQEIAGNELPDSLFYLQVICLRCHGLQSPLVQFSSADADLRYFKGSVARLFAIHRTEIPGSVAADEETLSCAACAECHRRRVVPLLPSIP